MRISKYFDKLNPIDKFMLISKNKESNKKISEIILLALYTIDKSIKENFQTNYDYYINDDATIKILIENSLNCLISDDIFFYSIIELDTCKLIYRFTCAKKFKIENENIKQLRINSWGKDAVIGKCKALSSANKSKNFK